MPPLLESLANCKELPDLGTGVVDNQRDLVTDTEPLLAEDLALDLGRDALSTEALLDFTCGPEGWTDSDEIWGFSDSDPGGELRGV